jgi:hypothetical protein
LGGFFGSAKQGRNYQLLTASGDLEHVWIEFSKVISPEIPTHGRCDFCSTVHPLFKPIGPAKSKVHRFVLFNGQKIQG